MSLAWGPRLTGGSLSWSAREASTTEGVINGSAEVLSLVERDLGLFWTVHGGVESNLSLLWQVDASPITAVESDLTVTWNVITEAGTSVERDLVLLWQRGGSVTTSLNLLWQVGPSLDVAGAAPVRRALKHPGWERKQAMDQLARERAMERSIRVALNGEEPAALRVDTPPQRTAAQMAAEMASAQRVQATRQRATEAAIEAQRARREIERLQPTLLTARRQASYRVIEQLLRQA
jgi:hypothetical protein